MREASGAVGEELPRRPIRKTFAAGCALYSCALTGASSGVTARATPAMKRRRDITGRPPARRREASPAEGRDNEREAAEA
jgi:hypothetical protein